LCAIKKFPLEKKNIYIKQQNHTKLYILPKDQIVFESKLIQNNIAFYSDIDLQPFTDNGIRYFILDSDRQKIDEILKVNTIIASTETISSYDYRDETKIQKIYWLVALIIVLTLITLDIII
jgi:hypothetical protein